MKEKSQVADIDRSVYDIRDKEDDAYRMQEGLTPEIIDRLSKEKGDPVWMQQFRLQSLQIYNEMPVPDWGPSIEGLDMDHIATYVRPKTDMKSDWKDVPQDIKDTFERLGIPQAERKSLAGVGAQYDSELVYHNVRDEVAAQGVVYTDMESALKGEYADMVHKYFMKLVTPRDHKFAALHGAVWSGGSFGSHVGCLYPMSVLKGDNSKMEFTGVTFAGAGQNLDTGAKVVHIGRNTSSYMNTRSISKSGGISTFRSSVVVQKGAKHAKSSVSCQSLMLDSESRSDTVPAMDIRTKDTAVGHEAKIGSISNEAVFYLMSRGMSEEDARALIVSGFADNVSKELPLEYAVEMNNLIRLEMKGSIG